MIYMKGLEVIVLPIYMALSSFWYPKDFATKNIAGHGVMIFMQVIVAHTLARNFVPTLFFLAKNL